MVSPPPLTPRPPGLDPVAAARWLRRVPSASPWLHEWVGERMAERLAWIRRQPRHWVSWSPLLAGEAAHRRVAQRYPQASVWLAGELAAATAARWGVGARPRRRWPWQRAAATRAEAEPPRVAPDGVPPDAVDMVWANMLLHAAPEPRALLMQWRDWLAVDGFVMLSCLGPDTARELRALHTACGWPTPAADYVDMHDWGDLLVEVGFAEPVMDMERVTLTYPDAERLLADLRQWGRNWHPARHPTLRGRGWRQRWLHAVQQGLPRDGQGRLLLTVEVIYGHAWRPADRAVDGVVRVPLQRLRDQLPQRRPG